MEKQNNQCQSWKTKIISVNHGKAESEMTPFEIEFH